MAQRNGFGRRGFLRTAAVGAALPVVGATLPATPAAAVSASPVDFRWLGTSGWRMDAGENTVLFDPYVTRFPTGLAAGAFRPDTPLSTSPTEVAAHADRAQLILVSHSHWDHLNDVPYIAKATKAPVVGTQTTCHLLSSLGVDPSQLVVVKGGEVLDFGYCTVEVVSSLHSRNKKHRYFAPGTLTAPPAVPPATISQLPEGDTLAFLVRFPDGPSAFLMGASDFAERNLTGLRPDVAMIAVQNSRSTHRYLPRLLPALGHPRTVVPVHWDTFESPLSDPLIPDPEADFTGFLAQVRQLSPRSRVVVPDYRATYRF